MRGARIEHATQLIRAFTLIELAIVLVIIALVAGGILIGRDMMRSAEIRATLRQSEQFNTAVNTFRVRFGCLPGDCVNTASFGFDAESRGNGDGIVGACGDCLVTSIPAEIQWEYIGFWYQLGAAGLIANTVSSPSLYAWPNDSRGRAFRAGIATPSANMSASRVVQSSGLSFPSGWAVAADFSYAVRTTATITTVPAHNLLLSLHSIPFTTQANFGYFPASSVFQLDAKADDGLPASGRVLAWTRSVYLSDDLDLYVLYPDAFDMCAHDGNPPQYNLASEKNLCGAAIKASF